MLRHHHLPFGLVALALLLSGCVNSAASAAPIDNPDEKIAACLTELGWGDDPLQGALQRERIDAKFAADLRRCNVEVLGEEELLRIEQAGLDPASRIAALNGRILDALSCTRDRGWAVDSDYKTGDVGQVLVESMIDRIPDAQLLPFYKELEDCGGPPAPNPPEGVGLVRTEGCVEHSHGTDPAHKHGDCE